MRFNTLFALLVVLCACLAAAQVSYEDCCLRYGKNIANRVRRNAVGYRRQMNDGGCNIAAIVFTMRGGHVLCANPTERWAKQAVRMLDFRKKFMKNRVASMRLHGRARS